ncbi:MAG: M23 family metallopeptidase [Anaerolineae bacterium]
MDLEPRSGYPKQIVLIAVMLLVLAGLIYAIATGRAPAQDELVGSDLPPVQTVVAGVRAVIEPEGNGGLLFLREPTEPAPVTVPPTSTPTPRPTSAPRHDHLWLERPISPEYVQSVDISYPYASRGDGSLPVHRGVELINNPGTPVLATAPGTIVIAGDDRQRVFGARANYYGLLVIQKLDQTLFDQPIYVVYGHLSEVGVLVGQRVNVGDVLGQVGMTGVALGPHLHLEVRYGVNAFHATVNPQLWLRPLEGRGALAGSLETVSGKPVGEAVLTLSRASEPGIPLRQITSYPGHEVNADPAFGENLVAGDLSAGEWIIGVWRGPLRYTERFTIVPGATTWVTLRVPD